MGERVCCVLVPPSTAVYSPEANGLVCCCRKDSGLECYLESSSCAAAWPWCIWNKRCPLILHRAQNGQTVCTRPDAHSVYCFAHVYNIQAQITGIYCALSPSLDPTFWIHWPGPSTGGYMIVVPCRAARHHSPFPKLRVQAQTLIVRGRIFERSAHITQQKHNE